MRKVIDITIKVVAWLLIVAILGVVGYFGYLLYKNDFSFNKTFGIGVSEKLVEEKEIESLTELQIDYNTAKVEIKKSEDGKIKIEMYCDRDCDHSIDTGKEEIVEQQFEDETEKIVEQQLEDTEEINEEEETGDKKVAAPEPSIVKVTLNEKKLKFWKRLFNHKVSRILVYLPEEYEGKVTINGDVGDISVGDYKFMILKTKANVGDIYIDGAKDCDVDLDVGSIKVRTTYSNFNIKLNTGDVRMKEPTVLVNSKIEVDVGNVKIDETNDIKIVGNVEVGKVNINVNNEQSEIELNVKTNVGNININESKKTEEEKKDNK